MNVLVLEKADYRNFRDWLKLNLDGLTWQGKFMKEFEEFWDTFFLDHLNLAELHDRFEFAKDSVKIGPLYTWFNWLQDKLICYCFIFKNISIVDLGNESQLSQREVSFILRNFFVERFPHLEERLGSKFQVDSVLSENCYLNFQGLSKEFNLTSPISGHTEDEIMTTLEITLYKEWKRFFVEMKSKLSDKKLNLHKIRSKANMQRQVVFVRELAALIAIGTVIILTVNFGNQWYEKYLAQKIRVFEPDFRWLDQAVSFKTDNKPKKVEEINMKAEEFDKLEQLEMKDFEGVATEEVAQVETEVALTSLDNIDRGFATVDNTISEYEEARPTNYRDSQYGQGKAYRLMMKTADPESYRTQLDHLLKKYEVTQVGSVKPGTEVPGGLYYNLLVPVKQLKNFLSETNKIGNAILYEGRTREGEAYPGKSKVFIWIKNI